jgi:hypothetical protein
MYVANSAPWPQAQAGAATSRHSGQATAAHDTRRHKTATPMCTWHSLVQRLTLATRLRLSSPQHITQGNAATYNAINNTTHLHQRLPWPPGQPAAAAARHPGRVTAAHGTDVSTKQQNLSVHKVYM